jgi:hypothetical protein
MRAPDESAGKRAKCPKCKTVVNVPSVSAPTARASGDRWYVKPQEGGETYGPVEKTELDEWVAEGRVTARTQILREGADQWQWAPEIYPQLQAQPQAGGPAFPTATPATGPAGASSSLIAIDPVGSRSSGVSYRRRNYPAMLVASKIYYVFGWIVIVLGILGVGGYLVAGLMSATAMLEADQGIAGIIALLIAFLTAAVLAVYVALTVITLWFVSEAIKAMMDIEDNTHKTTYLLQELVSQGQK